MPIELSTGQAAHPAPGAQPAVSVVIPVFNGAATIGRALASVYAQTYTDFEVLVVDDGSQDDLATALEPFLVRGVRLLPHPQNRGAAAARNTGIAAAHGRLVAFLDADDEWMPDKLARQVAYLDALPEDAQLCCTGFVLSRDGDAGVQIHLPAYRPDEPALPKLAFGCDLSPGSTMLARSECFDAIGPLDESLHRLEDWDWLLRYAARLRIGVVEAPLARIHPSGPRDAKRTLEALAALQNKLARDTASPTGGFSRRIRSSISVERAAVFYNRGEILRPMGYVAMSFLQYPLRNWSFFTRMVSHLLRGFRRR